MEQKNELVLLDNPAEKKPVVKQKSNIIAFRAKESELALLKQLQKDYQVSDLSAVLHKILGSFHGVAVMRAESIAKLRAEVEKWNVQHFELFSKQ